MPEPTLTVSELSPHVNYSLRVAGVTGVGAGVFSRPVFCATRQDGEVASPRLQSPGRRVSPASRVQAAESPLTPEPRPPRVFHESRVQAAAESPLTLEPRLPSHP